MDEEPGIDTETNIIDRGGLWNVNGKTYLIFHTIKEELRSHLNVRAHEESKKSILDGIKWPMKICCFSGPF